MAMHFPRTALPLLPLFTACGGGFATPIAHLTVLESELVFERVQFEVRHRVDVHLENPGTAATRPTIAVEGPFLASTDAVSLQPDGSTTIRVSFLPETYADASGTLILTTSEDVLRLPISATVNDDQDEDGVTAEGAGGDDCDDLRADVGPDQVERCDGVDNDCNGVVDDDAPDAPTWWSDADGDGFGVDGTGTRACQAPADHGASAGDCDDGADDVFPGATEKTDGKDQDCDGLVDEHLLVPGSLLVTELSLASLGDAPPYVEVRARAGSPLQLANVVLALGGASLTLPAAALEDCDVVLFCGQEEAGSVDGVPCLAPLPALPGPDQALSLTAEVELDQVDWSGWALPEDASLELDPNVDSVDGNDEEAAWAASTTPMGSHFGSPGATDACGG